MNPHSIKSEQMSRFTRSNFNLKTLTDNSYKAIDEGAYDSEEYGFRGHDSISIKKTILSCAHAPLIIEIKFSSPSRGRIINSTEVNVIELATIIVGSGASGLSVLTQPYLFNGSINYLARIRQTVNVPLLMKDITVSEIQIDAAKRIGADCVLLIKTIFDQDLAEGSIEKFSEYAFKKGLQVIIEVHSEKEFEEVLKFKQQQANLIGINNRDLNNLMTDVYTTQRLLRNHDKGKNIIISESGISQPKEIQSLKKSGVDAFLIGTSIMESHDIVSKVRELYLSL